MSYIGQQLPADVFSGFVTDAFTGNGSDTTFTLSKAPFSEDGLIVVINNVIQRPTTNFTVSGTTLTIVGTAVADGDVIYAIHTSGAVPSTLASKVDVNGLSDGVVLDADADTTISADTDDQIDFKAGGTDIMSLTATTVTINDGTTITTADNTAQLILTSTDADANAGPVLKLTRDSGSPADDDFLGNIQIEMDNDAGDNLDAVSILAQAKDVSNASEDARLYTYVRTAGSMRDRFSIAPSETVFNEDSVDVDFRIESDSSSTMFNLQATNSGNSAGSVGINSSNSDGNMFEVVNPQSGVYAGKFNVSAGSGGIYGLNLNFSGQTPDNNASAFIVANDSTTRFRVYADGDVQNHDNSYGAISDERIKSEIVDANSQWDDIKALRVRNYKKNEDIAQYGDKAWVQLGVIAQELEAAGMDKCVKQEVLYTADDQDVLINKTAKEGDIKEYKAVKYSILYMKAIKALQEAMAKIETLETKVKALEDA